MNAIERVRLSSSAGAADGASDVWNRIAECAAGWAEANEIRRRDAIVIVPFVELLPLARLAFAAHGVWMPRIETTRTLAAALGPPLASDARFEGFDPPIDALLAMQTLGREKWGSEWARRDRRAFEQAARRIVATARELARAAAAVAPDERAGWWQRGRDALRLAAGPDERERVLAQIAFEWAFAAPAVSSDRTFAEQPSAWIVVEAGGADPFVGALLGAAAVPALILDTDVSTESPFDEAAAAGEVASFILCEGFEDEACRAAAHVLDHVGRDERPVALIAQDRVLVRRIRALLERAAVRIADETGWKLSTTRAGAGVMSLLRAALPGASSDDLLDWLKSAPPGARIDPGGLASLEATLRRCGVTRRAAVGSVDLDVAAKRVARQSAEVLDALAAAARRSLPDWLDAVRTALERTGSLAPLVADAAGRQVLDALRIEPPLAAARRRALTSELDSIGLAEFIAHVDEVLELGTYRESSVDDLEDGGSPRTLADVVITPLARVMLRSFAAVVFPGADDAHLGARSSDDLLLPRKVVEALDLPDANRRRSVELLGFAQALRLPRITLLRRRGSDVEPIAESAFVERLRLALAERGRELGKPPEPRVARRLELAPVRRTIAVVPASALPAQISASAFEALRACPYRFFARSVLGLHDADELDDDVEKRDYGQWLHDVLHVFHREREEERARHGDAAAAGDALHSEAADCARLREIGAAKFAETGLDAAAFLPFEASFAIFVPRYVTWLHDRECSGWRWLDGETTRAVTPPELEGVELTGRIDRIDRRVVGPAGAGQTELALVDYKTGSASKLKTTVREPFEDTQLAFYAALVGARDRDTRLTASYLALDGTHALEEIPHDDVAASAAALVAGIAHDLRRLRAGAGLAPLGEGPPCEWCEARGLCRRDHWSADADAPAAGTALRSE